MKTESYDVDMMHLEKMWAIADDDKKVYLEDEKKLVFVIEMDK